MRGVKITTEIFKEKSNKVHNNQYNYSLVNVTGADIKVDIICPIHGIFKQTPRIHMGGAQCIECANIKRKQNKKVSKTRYTTESFIQKAKLIHGEKYDYSLVEYTNIKSKIKIICPIHGIFTQTAKDHIGNHGCIFCRNEYIGKNQTKSNDQFLLEAKNIFGNLYDYSLVNYKGGSHEIKIICPVHGIFISSANKHLGKGFGCPICRMSEGEKKIQLWLKEKNIFYKNEKTFKDLKYKYFLRFDFYLPDYNMCIEYDGEGHYKIISRSSTDTPEFLQKDFEESKIKDEIKNQYCRDNNINLLRIPYWDFKNINTILEKALN